MTTLKVINILLTLQEKEKCTAAAITVSIVLAADYIIVDDKTFSLVGKQKQPSVGRTCTDTIHHKVRKKQTHKPLLADICYSSRILFIFC